MADTADSDTKILRPIPILRFQTMLNAFRRRKGGVMDQQYSKALAPEDKQVTTHNC